MPGQESQEDQGYPEASWAAPEGDLVPQGVHGGAVREERDRCWHFGNKLGLLQAVLDDQLHIVLTAFDEQAGDPLDQVMDFIRLPAARLFITLLAEAVEDGSPIREQYARLHAALRQGVQARIPAEVLPAGASAEAFTVLLVGAVIGVHAQWRVAPEVVDLDAVRTLLERMIDA